MQYKITSNCTSDWGPVCILTLKHIYSENNLVLHVVVLTMASILMYLHVHYQNIQYFNFKVEISNVVFDLC